MTNSIFIDELKKIGIEINNEQLKQLETYYHLLIEWNEKINLTSITKKEDVYLKHFYDSACLAKAIDLNNENTLCDIGTGAGFPGLVIKILFPHLKVTLVDSLTKRINFLNLVIKELNLKDINALNVRAEEYSIKNREKFDIVTCRAVAKLNILLEYSIPLVKVNKYFIPLKGNISEEININHALQLLNTELLNKIEFTLPIENSVRTILLFKKNAKTSSLYPRSYSKIKQKGL